jgi:hypothetical protein
MDLVPKCISGYLQKGFFDLRSCIQRRRNDFIKQHVSINCRLTCTCHHVHHWQMPGLSLSEADAFHKSASEEVLQTRHFLACLLAVTVRQWSASGLSQTVPPHILSSCVPGWPYVQQNDDPFLLCLYLIVVVYFAAIITIAITIIIPIPITITALTSIVINYHWQV